jgi:hypothetical protein
MSTGDMPESERRQLVKSDALPKQGNAHAIGTGCQSQPSSAQSAQPSTLFARARSMLGAELGGRYQYLGKEQQIVGQAPVPYPRLPSGPWAEVDPTGDEKPFPVDIGKTPDVGKVNP